MKGIDTIFEGDITTPMDPQCVKGLSEITLVNNGFGAGLISVNTPPREEGGSYAYSL
jgi:hypothetical protein